MARQGALEGAFEVPQSGNSNPLYSVEPVEKTSPLQLIGLTGLSDPMG